MCNRITRSIVNLIVPLCVCTLLVSGCSNSSSPTTTNSNVPDNIYPYITGDSTLTKDTVHINDTVWTYFTATIPVTPNVKAAYLEIGKINQPFTDYAHSEGAVSPVNGSIMMRSTKVKDIVAAEYAPTITLYTGSDPTGDVSKPLTAYYCSTEVSLTSYMRMRWTQYHSVDTSFTGLHIPTILIP
jgi:hypothetical protein